MDEKIKVEFEFINRKKEIKKVKVWVDLKTYASLMSKEVSSELRSEYLKEEYYLQQKERYLQRKHNHQEINDDHFEVNVYQSNDFEELISCLNDNQKQLIRMIYVDGYNQKEVACLLKVSESAISHRLERIYKKIKKFYIDRQVL